MRNVDLMNNRSPSYISEALQVAPPEEKTRHKSNPVTV